jgi:hypothetical protein
MKKLLVGLLAATLLAPASAAYANTSQAVFDVSAYYRADLGYKVGWKTPADRTGVTGYVVTAQPGGQTCVTNSSLARECNFTTRTLGFTEQYRFTVETKRGAATVATSALSNPVSAASIPLAPLVVTSSVSGVAQVDVAWIPSANTGGAPLYGYKVTYWKSDTRGAPITATRTDVVVTGTTTTLSVERGFMYIINVASCNAYGCNSADNWSYANAGATNVTLPRVISGGSASTVCFESVFDVNVGESSLGTCGPVVADPSKYPVVVPSATTLNIVMATKFSQIARLSLNRSYSLTTWRPIGISWFASLNATSKSVVLGFEAAPTIWSTTPAVCEVVGPRIQVKSVGACSISAYVDENGVFERSNTVTQVITITN